MRVSRRPCFPALVLILSLTAMLPAYGSSEKAVKPSEVAADVQPPSDATYAQIVRISYVEGDVRIWRGAEDERATGATWERL